MLTSARSALFAAYLTLSAILLGMLCCWSLVRRDWALAIAKIWARGSLGALRLICGLDHELRGGERISTAPALYAVKHQSMWETVALSVLIPKPCFVLKKELLAIPVFGWWCRAAGFIGVDRAAGAAAMKQMITQARERAEEGCQILIFPEGTRIAPGEEGTYHPGVAGLYAGLDPRLRGAAGLSVLAHLERLCELGLVAPTDRDALSRASWSGLGSSYQRAD